MPNYIINKLNVIGEMEKVKEVMDFIRSDDGELRIDFEKIVPFPPYIYRGNLGKAEEDLFGEDTWYQWCPKYWGTKWNAMCKEDASRCTSDTIYFQTAWNGVPKLVYLLSSRFPLVDILYEFADEDIGYNCERYFLQKKHNLFAENEHIKFPGGSLAANAFAGELWGKKTEDGEEG